MECKEIILDVPENSQEEVKPTITKRSVVKKVVKTAPKTEDTGSEASAQPKQEEAEKPKIRRVAAYCRVSSLMEEQELSYESQCQYYRTLIRHSPNMKLVAVYGDDGFSGLHAKSRPKFMEMIADAKAGKMDEVMVKSISRFSRNVIDCQEYINILQSCGVRVFFERENIYSDDPQCGLVLKLLSAAAQEESNSISQNVRWSVQKNNENGNPTRVCPYGYVKAPIQADKRHVWLIDEEKAERIRYLFELAEKETDVSKIARLMREFEKVHGKTSAWTRPNILNRLRNEAYKGDILTSKTCTPDFLSGVAVENKGILQQIYLKDHHPAIVDRERFDRIQEYLKEGRIA